MRDKKRAKPCALMLWVAASMLYLPQLQSAAADPVSTTDAENSVRYQANTVCKSAGAALGAIPEPKESTVDSPRGWRVLKEYYSRYLKLFSPYVAQLHQVSLDQTGDAFKATMQEYIAQVDREVAALRDVVRALKSRDRRATAAAFKKMTTAQKNETRLARQLGLSDCKLG